MVIRGAKLRLVHRWVSYVVLAPMAFFLSLRLLTNSSRIIIRELFPTRKVPEKVNRRIRSASLFVGVKPETVVHENMSPTVW